MSERVIDSLSDRILDLDYEAAQRFLPDDDTSTHQFVDQMRNASTKNVTSSHTRLFSKWLRTRGENRAPEDIDAKQLDMYLAHFTLTVRKEGSGDDINNVSRQYEPSTMMSMHSSLFRYLNDKQYDHNIKTSDSFRHSREVLMSKMKELKQLGKGNKPRAAQAFTSEELAKLFQLNLLGLGEIVTH
jgi:hypothetical protein